MTNIDKRLIIKKIKLMEDDLNTLLPLSKFSFDELAKDNYKFLAAERLLSKIINRAIDINSHIISKTGIEPPQDYRDSFLKMIELKILSKKFVEKIIASVGLRNRLTHEYDDLNRNIIYESVFNTLDQYSKYLKKIMKFIDKK